MRFAPAALLAASSGLIASAAFDPLDVPYLMVLSLVVLFALFRQLADLRWWEVFGVGAAWGVAFFGPLIWWMRAVSEGAYVGLVIAEGVFLGVIALGLRLAAGLRAWPLALPAVWVLGEQWRGAFPFTGFPWGRLVHTSLDTPLESWVRLIGMPATSFLMACLATALLVVADASARHRLLAASAIVAAVLLGAVLPTGVAGQHDTARFAVIQGDVPGEFLSWPRGEIFKLHAAETQRLVDRIAGGDSPVPDVVLWPENSSDTDPTRTPSESERLDELVADLGAPILVGGMLPGPELGTVYNAGVVWTEDGPGESYVKRKPVPYGEYVPFRDVAGSFVPRVDRDIPRDMLPGDEPGGLTIGGVRIGDTICYDIAYDSVAADAIGDDAEVLVVQTSNAAFTGTAQPEQQWEISRLRAVETGRWVLVPSTNGISGAIDADGQVVERAPMRRPATIGVEVPLAEGRTPAARVGRPLGWLVVAAGLLAWCAGFARRHGEGME
ncbi:MAG: apolipoprotein N-acyltransferase [Aeromicrobium sp.]|uniref:apolipoprotein N-acyltransferase n=1 Tax=Aeromicrobium sp. TaxID=1871063 RepID=UPI0039E4B866